MRARLLLAFLAISAFAAVAAIAGIFALSQVGDALDHVTEERVPQAFSWVDLSRRAERIVQAAPTLLIVKSQSERESVAQAIAREIELLDLQMAQQDDAQGADKVLASRIRPAAQALAANLTTLDHLIGERLAIVERKDKQYRLLATTNRTVTRLFVPSAKQLETKLLQWEATSQDETAASQALSPEASAVARSLASLIPQQETARRIGELHDSLAKLGAADSLAEIPVLKFPVQRLLRELDALIPHLPRQIQSRLQKRLRIYRELDKGDNSLAAIRAAELEILGRAEQVLAENAKVSAELKAALDSLVTDAHEDIRHARAEARRVEEFSSGVLVTVVVLSLLSSALIYWLYVNRSLIARLTGLSDSMLAIAGGNLHAPLLISAGNDEISSMGKALSVFRDTAVEVEENNLREMATARQRLVDAIESISEGFAFFDADDHLELCNSQYRDFVQDPEGKMIHPGMTFSEIVRATAERGTIYKDGMDVNSYVAERIRQHRSPSGPLLYRLGDGRTLQINERKVVGGGTVAIYSDLTELKQRESELAELVVQLEIARDEAMAATEAKSQFLANMSHELRTPLNAIIGYSEMLIEDAEELGQKDFIPDLEKIHAAGKHLLGLINDILDLSKIEAGKMDLVVAEFSVADFLSHVRSLIEPMVAQNNNQLQVELPDDLGAMHSDEIKLRQSLVNLLSNALKFTRNGLVKLSAQRLSKADQDWLEFTVTDNGIGMTPEQLDRLFQAFSQAEQTTSRDYGGTGLGLAISKRFCQLLGGDISVESSYGEGSTFKITLPANLRRTDVTAHADGLPSGDASAGIVLVIDDDAAVYELLQSELSKLGYVVRYAANGKAGLKMAKELHPDLITLDIIMPDLDGWSVLQSLRADQELSRIPVVIVTVMGDKQMGFALGAADFVTKPINRDQLAQVVNRHRKSAETQILIVDDKAESRNLLRRILAKEGWSIVEAGNGKEALQRLKTIQPALVLLDLMMPEMDGFELLETMRGNASWAQIPVVIVTAKDPTQQEMESLQGNVLQVLKKGDYDRKQLINDIRAMLSEHGSLTL